MKCPICESYQTEELVIDLRACNICNHIFKSEPVTLTHRPEALECYKNPVNGIRERLKSGQTIFEFTLPTMNFYGLLLEPTLFYNYEINHYFNQTSLITLFQRIGLKPIKQTNEWNGNVCVTKIVAQRDETVIWIPVVDE
jgi:hypothetical protein